MRISKTRGDRYVVTTRRARRLVQQEFDAVVVALPYNRLLEIEWAGERLRRAMAKHVAYYDRPGHYLRISILFDRPFWRRLNGVLGHARCVRRLLRLRRRRRPADSGEVWCPRLAVGRRRCAGIVQYRRSRVDCGALESLPADLYDEARQRILEGQVHRWAGARERSTGRLSPARPGFGAPTGTGRASGTGHGWRLSVRLDVEWGASFGAHRDRLAARSGVHAAIDALRRGATDVLNLISSALELDRHTLTTSRCPS